MSNLKPGTCNSRRSKLQVPCSVFFAMIWFMRRLALPLGISLLLVSCGGGSAVCCDKNYVDEQVTICLPDGWIVLDRTTLEERGAPDDTIIAFQTEEPVSGQLPTVTVTFEPLADPIEPAEYSQASIRAVAALPGYELVDTSTVTIDDHDVDYHTFNAQPIADEPKRRFYQVATTSDDGGYAVTASTPIAVTDDLEEQVKAMLTGVTFEAPPEE